MNPFRQTIVLSLVLVVIMVYGVATQTTNHTTRSTNAATTAITQQLTSATKTALQTNAATNTDALQLTTTLPKITAQPVQTQPTSTTVSTANITYECYANETIRLVGSHFLKSYEILRITSHNLSSDANCNVTKESDGGFLIEGKDCFNNLLRGGLTAENNSNIVGGRSFTEFTFECDDLPKNGTIKTVTLKVSSQKASGPTSRPAITLQPQSPFLALQCTVTDDKNTVKGTFVDGEVEVLHIKGPAAYYMYLQDCIAFNGTSADSSYTKHTLYKDFNPVDYAIVDKAIDGRRGEITINVYAFHFVRSSDVTYQCTILVCPDTKCHPQNNTSGRKRRATSVSEQVEASVKVLEKYDLNGNTVSSAERTVTALFLLVASMSLLTSFF